MFRLALSIFLLVLAGSAQAAAPKPLKVHEVADGVYALVGDLAQRAPENLGNNATFGVVVTDEGVVLIDSGGCRRGAQQIEETIRTITDKPVIAVINTGGQDHRWLGNAHFKSLGARLIASEAAVEDQAERADAQIQGLNFLLGEELVAGTEPLQADEAFAEALDLTFGSTRLQIRHAGATHTPGHAYAWLPDEKVLFAGDAVYLERLLGINDVSALTEWIEMFEITAGLEPRVVVPGHGAPAPLAKAQAETYDYLVNLRDRVRAVIEDGGGEDAAVEVDQSRFAHLANFEQLARRNALAAFVLLEFE